MAWKPKVKIQAGRFTAWCKAHGFTGPNMACIAKARQSESASVRGMANFAWRAKKGWRRKVKV